MRLGLISLSLLLILACGYHMESRKTTLPSGATNIYIEPFQNATTTAQVEKFFTDAIKREFYNKRDVRVVRKSQAQVTLHGVIKTVSVEGTAFKKNINAGLEAKEFLLTILVSIDLKDRAGKVLWQRDFSDQEVFNVFENIMKSESERLKASHRISKNMMRKVYDTLFASFKRKKNKTPENGIKNKVEEHKEDEKKSI